MFVVEVWTLVLPSALRTSAGSPERVSTMAVKDLHVRCATCCGVSADAPETGIRKSIATSAATNLARMAWRDVPHRFGGEPRAFRHVSVRGQAVRRFHPEGGFHGPGRSSCVRNRGAIGVAE